MPISVDDGDFKFRPVGSLLRVNPKPRLQRLATEITARRGPPKPSFSQPIGILKSAAIKLENTGGDMEALGKRERKAAIELFWIRMHGWNPDVSHIQTWLRWATNEWGSRRAEVNKRLARQNQRIRKEVKEGDMTKAQAATLHKDDRQVRKEERSMASQNGGHITRQEKRTLNQQENQLSRQIGK